MNKLSHVVVEESMNDSVQEPGIDSDQLYLQKQKEDEIRMKLDQFARELSQLQKYREEH